MNIYKKNYVKVFTSLFFLSLLFSDTQAQLLAFTGKDTAGSTREFAFVALQQIPKNTTIYFTNENWNNTTGSFDVSTKGTLQFTSTTIISKGIVTHIEETSANVFSVTTGVGTATIVGVNDWNPFGGTPHYSFISNVPANPLTNVNEVYALISTEGPLTGTQLDPRIGVNLSANAVVCDHTIDSSAQGLDFTADRSTATVSTISDCSGPNYTSSFGGTTLDLTNFGSLPVELQSFSVE